MLGSHILYVDYFTDMIYTVSKQVSVVCLADCSHAMPPVCFKNSELLKKQQDCDWLKECFLLDDGKYFDFGF